MIRRPWRSISSTVRGAPCAGGTSSSASRLAPIEDARNKSVLTVCPLCIAKADRSGWQLLGERSARRPLPVNVDNEVDHERLVVRLQSDLERLEHDLGGSQSSSRRARLARAAGGGAGRAAPIARGGPFRSPGRSTSASPRRTASSPTPNAARPRASRRRRCCCGRVAARPTRRTCAASPPRSSTAHRTMNAVLEPGREEHGNPSDPPRRRGPARCRAAIRVTFAWSGRIVLRYRVTCDLVARLFDVEDPRARATGLQSSPFAPFPLQRAHRRRRLVVQQRSEEHVRAYGCEPPPCRPRRKQPHQDEHRRRTRRCGRSTPRRTTRRV